MDDNWNFDMSQAPRGRTETYTVKAEGKKDAVKTKHIPDLIIAGGRDGTVTVSRWLPDQERWNMFSKDAPPIAWQPWPAPPVVEAA